MEEGVTVRVQTSETHSKTQRFSQMSQAVGIFESQIEFVRSTNVSAGSVIWRVEYTTLRWLQVKTLNLSSRCTCIMWASRWAPHLPAVLGAARVSLALATFLGERFSRGVRLRLFVCLCVCGSEIMLRSNRQQCGVTHSLFSSPIHLPFSFGCRRSAVEYLLWKG